ncbi:hypothetical protein P153DRAFT_355077 [Dothidotthia symphoricarpi CBS 119687]|uniref:Uncharacterized protein n=1 Tax=Dothidotthia symphoricarpi CBS 119687 TaxID=1392245 RepID=A0A6A6AJG3_9PLEO|nr:uncharacterized protein P153DRAFT_355077 [Dothidotthia symphoricarpi CBS 119687]KAF2131245.1 hypothetical protein P153DRAFT_355077 [Dothidotthia symphoricarpi CBS 119687]
MSFQGSVTKSSLRNSHLNPMRLPMSPEKSRSLAAAVALTRTLGASSRRRCALGMGSFEIASLGRIDCFPRQSHIEYDDRTMRHDSGLLSWSEFSDDRGFDGGVVELDGLVSDMDYVASRKGVNSHDGKSVGLSTDYDADMMHTRRSKRKADVLDDTIDTMARSTTPDTFQAPTSKSALIAAGILKDRSELATTRKTIIAGNDTVVNVPNDAVIDMQGSSTVNMQRNTVVNMQIAATSDLDSGMATDSQATISAARDTLFMMTGSNDADPMMIDSEYDAIIDSHNDTIMTSDSDHQNASPILRPLDYRESRLTTQRQIKKQMVLLSEKTRREEQEILFQRRKYNVWNKY